MPEPPAPSPGVNPPVRERLQEIAALLRSARHLGPQVKNELADLLQEMAGELESTPPSPQAEHLAETAAHLARELSERRGEGPLAAATHRLETAAARAEAKAPVVTGLARRFIDLLADIGI